MSPTFHLPVERPDLCAPCGGACCKRLPGASSPKDWGAPDRSMMRERLLLAIGSGRWALDWWEGEDEHEHAELRVDVFFPRPSPAGDEGDMLYPDDMGPRWAPLTLRCTFLTPTGCELASAERPHECRALEPQPGGIGCVAHAGDKAERAVEWAPYSDLLRDVREHVEAR